jgi:biopolymer transport protein ExbD
LVEGKPVVDVEEVVDKEGRPTFRVADSEKKGQLITELFEELLEKAEEQKQIASETGLEEAKFKGQLLLQCDRELPFELIREVMYTAGQAQFGEFKFVVIKANG